MSTPSASLPSHRTVRVDLGARAYDVLIGRGLLTSIDSFLQDRGVVGTFFIIADSALPLTLENTLRIPLQSLCLKQGQLELSTYRSPRSPNNNEENKSLENFRIILSDLAIRKLTRSGVIIALGGGVIGDLAGFVAATYLRGVNFVQVPTTLLAMVDSSVGGKTGVNLPEGKNLVGAFYQPKLVIADLDALATLPATEFAAGMAEIIKYGAIADRALFDRVAQGVKPEDADLAEIIETCVAIKARIVEQDEFEEKGLRALLNFGHTLGHAIEKATDYKFYLHGEAVSLGMRAAAWLSHWESGLSLEEVHLIEKSLLASGLPTHLDEPDDSECLLLVDKILKALGNDKKVAGDGKNRWVLLTKLGKAKAGYEIKSDVVEAALQLILKPVSLKDES